LRHSTAGRTLADILDYFAAILRGAGPDLDGPPLESFPSSQQLRRVLERRTEALERAEVEWRRLPWDEQERLAPPDELG
jgi:hypothetical protein